MVFTALRWYILKVLKHVINQINHEIDLNTLTAGQIGLLRKRLNFIKEKATLMFTNYYYLVVVILDAIGLIIAFYSVIAFGFKTRISLTLLYTLIMVIFKILSTWFISEVFNEVKCNLIIYTLKILINKF